MSTIHRLGPNRVTADIFTASYRFSATLLIYKRRLIDILSDPAADFLDMVDVYISRINNPGDIVATYKNGTLVKNEINFILLASEEDGASEKRHFGIRQNLPLFLSIHAFEIHGKIQWGGEELKARKLLAPETQQFITMLEVTAHNSLFPEVVFEGPMALVNKSKIQVVCTPDSD